MTRQKILIVDDQEMIRAILQRYIRKAGYDVLTAENGEEAIALYRTQYPALVISDIKMPKMTGLELLREIKKIDERALVILITGFGNEEILLEALRGGAVNFFKKPFEIQEILDVINHTMRHQDLSRYRELLSPAFEEETKTFLLTPEDTTIIPIIQQIGLNLYRFFSDAETINLKIGIEEMINNAVEHGCLGIGFLEKNRALHEGKYSALVKKRIAAAGNKTKRVFITAHLSKDDFTVQIRDEGDGFDWKDLPDLSRENLLQYNGRGILLTRIFYDEVSYNPRGNQVLLRKKPGIPARTIPPEHETVDGGRKQKGKKQARGKKTHGENQGTQRL